MFGVSFPELMLIGAVALIIVGPQRLPGMLGTLGKWSSKLRRMLFDVRQQSGIDDILRAEGISGGLKEIRDLRNAVRGNVTGLLTTGAAPPRQGVQQLLNQSRAQTPAVAAAPAPEVVTDPYADVVYDRSREYPDEGCDAYGSIPDDLWSASHPEPKPASIGPTPTAAGSSPTASVGSLDAVAVPVAVATLAEAVAPLSTVAPLSARESTGAGEEQDKSTNAAPSAPAAAADATDSDATASDPDVARSEGSTETDPTVS